MSLKPWYKVITPREDLREGKPLDASEFAVHLDQVRDKRAPSVYQNPEEFFERTYLTQNLTSLAAEVVRRLSGETTECSAVFNMSTQFGGGKTHALTLLYHLAKNGSNAERWQGVKRILERAGVPSIPHAETAVFVGTEFDSITGRGGDDGTPKRMTPWGEIAYQLGGEKALAVLAEHEKQMTAPAGDVIREFLPKDKACLILLDELMNYVSRNRKSGMGAQLYNFIHNLTEEVRGHNNIVLAVSIPASELEMNAEDQADYMRFKKILDRLGKAVILSAETETSEIIRRRLFEWGGLPDDAKKTISEYADWVNDHRKQLPNWFPVDNAREAFTATYPFHPITLSVFERKWQALPRFQQTRGILRLLALWVSKAYQEGYKGAHKDSLIGLGTAPLDDPMFRTAVFEQLGESKLEGAVTTDICGKKESHAVRLDNEAIETIKKSRLHRKVATTIFFESNGGQAKAEATAAEIRLAVAEPDLDIGNVETVLEALSTSCYFMMVEGNKYRFSLKPNLNRLLADRRASIQQNKIEERVRNEVQKVFAAGPSIERVFFPTKSNQIPDRPALTFVVLSTEQSMQEEKKVTLLVDSMTKEYGSSARTFKSALIWCIPDSTESINDEARKSLAWEALRDEDDDLRLDDAQKRQLSENLKRAQKDLSECVWRTYKYIMLLGKDNSLKTVDFGLVHSSSADTLIKFYINRLSQDGEVEDKGISPTFLVRYWPPAFKEWSTKSVRDAFFSSPQFPRLMNQEFVRDAIARGVSSGIIGYVGKNPKGGYDPFHFGDNISANDVEISDEMFIITAEEAEKHKEPPTLTSIAVSPQQATIKPGKKQTFTVKGYDQHKHDMGIKDVRWGATGGAIGNDGVLSAGQDEGSFVVTATIGEITNSASFIIAKVDTPPPPPPSTGKKKIVWSGDISPQKWMTFYTKVLVKHISDAGLKITVNFECAPEDGVSEHAIEEAKVALRELGLNDDIKAD